MNTLEGGRAVVKTMTKKHGSYEAYQEHMREIASKGGKKTGVIKGFAYAKQYSLDDPRHPSNCGRKGGTISRRGNGTKQYVEKNGYFHKLKEMFV